MACIKKLGSDITYACETLADVGGTGEIDEAIIINSSDISTISESGGVGTITMLTGKKGYEPGIIYMSSMTGASGKDVDYQYSYDDKGRIKSIKTDYDYNIEGWVNADYSRLSTFEYSDDKLVTMTVSTIDPAGNSIPGYSKYYYNDKGNIAKTTDNVIIDNKERIISQALVK